MSSEIKLISTLQKDNESLRNENRELKKELESYKRKKRFWQLLSALETYLNNNGIKRI